MRCVRLEKKKKNVEPNLPQPDVFEREKLTWARVIEEKKNGNRLLDHLVRTLLLARRGADCVDVLMSFRVVMRNYIKKKISHTITSRNKPVRGSKRITLFIYIYIV